MLDRHLRILGRDTGWNLENRADPGAIIIDNSATYTYGATDGQFKTGSDGTDTFTYGYTYSQTGSGPRVGDTNGTKQDYIPYTLTKTGGILKTLRTFEATRDVLASIQNKAGVKVVSMYDYSTVNGGVNNLGQRMGVETTFNLTGAPTTQATSWAYDSLGQITSANLPGADLDRAYAYDSIGNRLTAAKGNFAAPGVNSTFTVAFLTEYFGSASSATPPQLSSPGANSLNQYAAIRSPSATIVLPEHDLDGNMTHGPLPVSPGANCTLVWDAENRLVEVKNSNNVTLVKYAYDAQSRRIATSHKIGTLEILILFVHDGWNCIAEYAGVAGTLPTIERRCLWGLDLSGSPQGAGGVGGLLALSQGGTTYYPTYDGNGNVSEYLAADGAIAAHFEYDPFGNTVVTSGESAGALNYRFSTKPMDALTGLYYYGYRWYDPLTGRWPSRDPIEEGGGLNLYGFVENDGVGRWDLIGDRPFDTKEEARAAAIRDLTRLAAESIEKGKKEINAAYGKRWDKAEPVENKNSVVGRMSTGGNTSTLKFVMGVEYGADVYCWTNGEKTQFDYSDPVVGTLPTKEQVGSQKTIYGQVKRPDNYFTNKLYALVDRRPDAVLIDTLHTHILVYRLAMDGVANRNPELVESVGTPSDTDLDFIRDLRASLTPKPDATLIIPDGNPVNY